MRYILLLFLLISSYPLDAQSKMGDQSRLDSLLLLQNQPLSDSARLQLYYDLMSDYNNINPRESMRFADSTVLWARKLENPKRLYQAQYAKGAGYFFLGENDSAAKYVQIAREGALVLDIKVDIADLYNLQGSVQNAQGDYVGSLESFQQGLSISREINDTASIYTLLVNMAEIYSIQKDYQQSINNYQEGLDLILATQGLGFAAAVVYNNLAELPPTHPDTAIAYLEKAYNLFTKFGYADGQAHTHANMGHRYLEKLDYEEAINQYLKAAKIWEREETNFKPGLVLTYSGLAKAYAYKQQYVLGRNYAEKAITLAEKFSLKAELKEAYLASSKLEELAGRPELALQYLRKGSDLAEELMNESRTKELASSRIRFQTEEKERELVETKLKLSESDLELARKKNQNNLVIFSGLGILLLLIGIFQYLRFKQRLRRKETEAALLIQQTEAENLRELDQLKSRFFANISHEFRTPLTLILGPLQKMLDGSFDGSPRTYLEMMQRNGERLQQLINQLLDLSRLESGKMELRLERGDVVGFLRTLAAQFDSWAESKLIHFHIDLPEKPVITAFDRDKLEKTVTNLLSNAFKFTPEEGDVWLQVSVVEEELQILVEDNGIGMSEEQLEHVFDRFYRIETGSYEGSGIGLALVKELTELANGRISVSSTMGKGSVFTLMLPLLLDQSAPELSMELAKPLGIPQFLPEPDSASKLDGKKPLLLVVEDNIDLRQLLANMLSSDYDVRLAENGKIGLEKAQELIPDVVISDIMMPEMDGYELTAILKSDERTSHIPVIQLTAKVGLDAKIEGLEQGADDYLSKPFDERELKVRLRNVLAQRERIRKQYGKAVIHLGPSHIAVSSADEKFISRVIDIIESYMQDDTFSIEDLGREVGLSRSQLHRKLKALTDQSPSVFLRSIRLARAKQMLEQGIGTAAEVSYQVGFGSPAYFSRCFKEEYGLTPGEVKGR